MNIPSDVSRDSCPENLETGISQTNLPEKILEGLLSEEKFEIPEGGSYTRLEIAKQKGYHYPSDEEGLNAYIQEKFREYENYLIAGEYFKEDSKISNTARGIYGDISELLIVSNVAHLITLDDWSVNRLRMAEKSLGLRAGGYTSFQQTLSQKYCRIEIIPAHLVKGSGNGRLPHNLEKERFYNSELHEWNDFSIGDKLYFALEEMLFGFIKSAYKENENVAGFIGVIAGRLKKELKTKWFEQSTSTIQEWKQIAAFCDMNDLFPILNTLIGQSEIDLSDVYDPTQSSIVISEIFEHDAKKYISLEMEAILMRASGWDTQRMHEALLSKAYPYYKSRLKKIKDKQRVLREIKNSLKKMDESSGGSDQQEINNFATQISELVEISFPKDVNVSTLVEYLEECIREHSDIIKEESPYINRIKQARKQFQEDGIVINLDQVITDFGENMSLYDENKTSYDYGSQFFEESFLDAVEAPDNRELDLNRHPNLYWNNFKQGYFTEIPKLYPQKFMLMTGCRSDSHENAEQFREDIRGNLNSLSPGGCLLTDGIKQSFTGINRIDIIKEVIDELGCSFKAETIIDSNSGSILGILVQKNSDEGYLTDIEKATSFDDYVVFEDIEKTLLNPYHSIIDEVRKRVFDLTTVQGTQGSVDIFNKARRPIKEGVDNALVQVGRKKLEEYVDDIRYGREFLLDAIKRYDGLWQLFQIKDIFESNDESLTALGIPSDEVNMIVSYFGYEGMKKIVLHEEEFEDKEIWEIAYPESGGLINRYTRGLIRSGDLITIEDSSDVVALVSRRITKFIKDTTTLTHPTTDFLLKPIEDGMIYINGPGGDGTRGFRAKNLPDNSFFESLEAEHELEDMTHSFKKDIELFGKKLKDNTENPYYKPLLLISYVDCVTNVLLLEKLKQIFGEQFIEQHLEILEIRFHHDKKGIESIADSEIVYKKLQNRYKNGGIIIGGGSWTDSNDEYGVALKELLGGGEGLEEFSKGGSLLRRLDICVSAQSTIDLIALNEGDDSLKTKSGVLEMGPTPVLVRAHNHPVLSGLERFTVAMTHSSHMGEEGMDITRSGSDFQILATSDYTGLPAAYDYKGRIIGIQWHPEIDLRNLSHINILHDKLGPRNDELRRKFGVGDGRIRHNFNQITDEVLKADAGDFILLRSLNFLVKSI